MNNLKLQQFLQKEFTDSKFLTKKRKHTEHLLLGVIPNISQKSLNLINSIISNKNTKQSQFNDILPPLSLREKYADLLTRRELILPPKYLLLLKKQILLDGFLSNTPNEHKFENILNSFYKNSTIFTKEDFEKMLYVAPFYYIYQSKAKLNGNIELLCIDIPLDIEKRMKVIYHLYLFFRGNIRVTQTLNFFKLLLSLSLEKLNLQYWTKEKHSSKKSYYISQKNSIKSFWNHIT